MGHRGTDHLVLDRRLTSFPNLLDHFRLHSTGNKVTTSSPSPSRIGLECPKWPPRTMFKVHLGPLQGHVTGTCLLMIIVKSIPHSISERRFAPWLSGQGMMRNRQFSAHHPPRQRRPYPTCTNWCTRPEIQIQNPLFPKTKFLNPDLKSKPRIPTTLKPDPCTRNPRSYALHPIP